MATLGQRHELVKINYVNRSFQSHTPVLLLPNVYETWSALRYALESGFGTFVNHTTFLRGYTDSRLELKDKDPVPDVLLVRRFVMPLGLRQYVPPAANVKYMKAKQELQEVCRRLQEENDAYELFVQSIDYTNYQEATFERSPHLVTQKESLEAFLKSSEQKCGLHASAFTELPVVLSSGHVDHRTSYVKPWPTYICQLCLKQGHHFKDACYLFPQDIVHKDVTFKWGAQKMKKLHEK